MESQSQFEAAPVELAIVRPARWYIACTLPRHEKQVAARLAGREVECFLPLYRAQHHWQDRWKFVELPLLPGYVFARVDLADRLSVLTVPGVRRLLITAGKPAVMDESEIAQLRHGLARYEAEPHPFLRAGERVRVRAGPFAGAEGILLRKKGGYRAVVNVELLMRAFSIEIDLASLEILN